MEVEEVEVEEEEGEVEVGVVSLDGEVARDSVGEVGGESVG